MYEFIDTIRTSEGVSLPSEALQINGEYIENLVTGYRTLTVAGREALSPEVTTYETGIRDGSTLKGKKYPARIITITYQLIASTNEEFREAYNKLASVLDVQDAELIFADETDKFFVGTPSMIGEVAPGQNSVVGEFQILCVDPFKYSVMEYEATTDLSESSMLVDYKGTYKSYPKLQANFHNENETSEDGETEVALTGNGECGYVAFFNEREKIIQLGDPEEADGETAYAKSQCLINQDFKSSTSWGSAAKRNWLVNKGVTSSNVVVQTGNVGLKVASYANATQKTTTATLLSTVSKSGSPYVHYEITATSKNRTKTSVDIVVMISARLDNKDSYFGKGYQLTATVGIGDLTKMTILKTLPEHWSGTTWHKASLTFNVTGLEESTTKITNIQFKTSRPDGTGGTAGYVSRTHCKDMPISAYLAPEPQSYYLTTTDFGTGDEWHGASITRSIPYDATNIAGATDFELYYSQRFGIGNSANAINECGAFQVLLTTDDNKIVAGVNVFKGGSGKVANLRFYTNNSVYSTVKVNVSPSSKYFNTNKTTTITKFGGKITFNVCGIEVICNEPSTADMVVKKVTFTFTKHGTKPQLTHNGLYLVRFTKHNCNTYREIQNKFVANDVLEADCKTGEILLNGNPKPALGALGNDWEEFYLKPGLNQIGYSFSDWVDEGFEPTIKLKYREVFL